MLYLVSMLSGVILETRVGWRMDAMDRVTLYGRTQPVPRDPRRRLCVLFASLNEERGWRSESQSLRGYRSLHTLMAGTKVPMA